jgi:hypothetical protein
LIFLGDIMQKHSKAADLHAKAGEIVSLVVTQIITLQNKSPAATPLKPGKLNYQAKPKKSAPKTEQLRQKNHSVSSIAATAGGKYFGNGQQLTAFVWLDDEPTPAQGSGQQP